MPGPTELQITYTHAPRFRSTEAAALEYLEDHGYVIIANALTKTETSTAMDKLWSYLESLETGIDQSDPDTWGDNSLAHSGAWPDFAAGFCRVMALANQRHSGTHGASRRSKRLLLRSGEPRICWLASMVSVSGGHGVVNLNGKRGLAEAGYISTSIRLAGLENIAFRA